MIIKSIKYFSNLCSICQDVPNQFKKINKNSTNILSKNQQIELLIKFSIINFQLKNLNDNKNYIDKLIAYTINKEIESKFDKYANQNFNIHDFEHNIQIYKQIFQQLKSLHNIVDFFNQQQQWINQLNLTEKAMIVDYINMIETELKNSNNMIDFLEKLKNYISKLNKLYEQFYN